MQLPSAHVGLDKIRNCFAAVCFGTVDVGSFFEGVVRKKGLSISTRVRIPKGSRSREVLQQTEMPKSTIPAVIVSPMMRLRLCFERKALKGAEERKS